MSIWDTLSETADNLLQESQNEIQSAAKDWFKKQISPPTQPPVAVPPPPPSPAFQMPSMTALSSPFSLVLIGIGILAIFLFKGK